MTQGSAFPDQQYLGRLLKRMQKKAMKAQSPLTQLSAATGTLLNWVGYYLTDPAMQWRKEDLAVDALWLTGTWPGWNAVILDRCERSPFRLRELIRQEPEVAQLFADAPADKEAILVRFEDGKYKVLDGMDRAVAAIRDGAVAISAFIATPTGPPKTQCEPHVAYDLIAAYQRGLNRDREGLVAALRFLIAAYANISELLRTRFISSWLPDNDIQKIIREVLAESVENKSERDHASRNHA